MCVAILASQWSLRLVGYPGAAYRSNADNSSQRGQTICVAEARTTSKYGFGSMVDFESRTINKLVCQPLLLSLIRLPSASERDSVYVVCG